MSLWRLFCTFVCQSLSDLQPRLIKHDCLVPLPWAMKPRGARSISHIPLKTITIFTIFALDNLPQFHCKDRFSPAKFRDLPAWITLWKNVLQFPFRLGLYKWAYCTSAFTLMNLAESKWKLPSLLSFFGDFYSFIPPLFICYEKRSVIRKRIYWIYSQGY